MRKDALKLYDVLGLFLGNEIIVIVLEQYKNAELIDRSFFAPREQKKIDETFCDDVESMDYELTRISHGYSAKIHEEVTYIIMTKEL